MIEVSKNNRFFLIQKRKKKKKKQNKKNPETKCPMIDSQRNYYLIISFLIENKNSTYTIEM